jgi:hypothetical protein
VRARGLFLPLLHVVAMYRSMFGSRDRWRVTARAGANQILGIAGIAAAAPSFGCFHRRVLACTCGYTKSATPQSASACTCPFSNTSSSKLNNQPCTQTCSSTNNNMAVLVLYVSGAIAFYIFLRCLLAFTHDAKEPVALATEIPFLSPLIGMRKKARFNIDIR